jgi:hypothetical protein
MAVATLDFSTPEGAIKALEAAYISKDIEAAVAAKDFNEEARLMMVRLHPQYANDSEILSKTAEALELSFRKQMREKGFPDFGSCPKVGGNLCDADLQVDG